VTIAVRNVNQGPPIEQAVLTALVAGLPTAIVNGFSLSPSASLPDRHVR